MVMMIPRSASLLPRSVRGRGAAPCEKDAWAPAVEFPEANDIARCARRRPSTPRRCMGTTPFEQLRTFSELSNLKPWSIQ